HGIRRELARGHTLPVQAVPGWEAPCRQAPRGETVQVSSEGEGSVMGYGVIVREVSVAANTTVENILAGSQFEIMTDPSIVSIGETASATGLVSSLNVGARMLKEAAPPVIRTAMPVQPDDFYFNAPA